MIGSLDRGRREATVIGAGISGLLAAWNLERAGIAVTLLEAEPRAGGLIRTTSTPCGIAESAAHSLVATESVRELCAELAKDSPAAALAELNPRSRAKFIWRAGRMRRMPLSLLEIAGTLRRACFARDPGGEAESVESWGRRHLGPAALDWLLNPFVRGIYGARPRELCVSATFPSMATAPGQTLIGAVRAGRRGRDPGDRGSMAAPHGGMGALVGALERALERKLGARFVKGRRVEHLPDAPNVVLAVPASAAAKLLASADPALAAALERVPYTPLVSVTAFAERSKLRAFRPGVGVLVPEREGRDCLGVLFNSSSFPERVSDEESIASFTVMLGGTANPEWVAASDAAIRAAVARELAALIGLDGAPVHQEIHRWERAIPQYGPALLDAWRKAREGWCARPGRVLFGNFAGQVSLRGMIGAARGLMAPQEAQRAQKPG